MPKPGPKPKAIAKLRHNLYSYQIPGPFLGNSKDFLRTAKGQDSKDEATDNDIAINDIRRRSWTCEQKLCVIKYATSTYILGKAGSNKLITNNAATVNIRCTSKMLRT
jgi:hypothetical protein